MFIFHFLASFLVGSPAQPGQASQASQTRPGQASEPSPAQPSPGGWRLLWPFHWPWPDTKLKHARVRWHKGPRAIHMGAETQERGLVNVTFCP